MIEPSRPSNVWPRALTVIGVCLFLIAMGGIANNEFVEWDDWLMISKNVRFGPPTFASVLPYALPRNAVGALYIPLTQYFWGLLSVFAYLPAADQDGSHLNPWVFHSASIGVHLGSAVLVFLCIQQMLRVVRPARNPFWPAWVGAMVFAIHPVQVEAVAWASGMKDVLSGFFGMLCVYAFLRFRGSAADEQRSHWLWFGIATVALLAATFSKVGAVATPLSLLVIDVILLRTRILKSSLTLLPWVVLMLPFVFLTRHLQPFVWKDLKLTPFYLRPFVAGDALAFYTWKLLAPVRLSFDYNRRPETTLASGVPFFDWIVPVGIIVWCLLVKERRLLLAGVGVTIASLLPVLGFVHFGSQDFSTVADHYLYPAMLGVAMCVAWLIDRFRGWWSTSIVWIALAIWTILSAQACEAWQTTEQLCRHALQLAPDSWNALNGLGATLEAKGDYAEAEKCYRRSIALNGRNVAPQMNLVMMLIRENRGEDALFVLQRMMSFYQLQNDIDWTVAENAQVAIALMMLKNHHPDLAAQACREALTIDPKDPRAMAILSRIQQTFPPSTTHGATSTPLR